VPLFGNARFDPTKKRQATPRLVQIEAMDALVRAGIRPVHLAIAFVRNRVHPLGARRIDRLKEDLAAAEARLDENLLAQIDFIYRRYTSPAAVL
jgi:aryl-alcohol dehydrogenase-like predicted oxidoreductase